MKAKADGLGKATMNATIILQYSIPIQSSIKRGEAAI